MNTFSSEPLFSLHFEKLSSDLLVSVSSALT